MPQEKLPKKPLVRRSLCAIVAAYDYCGSGWGRPGDRPSIQEVARQFNMPKSTIGEWVAEFGRWDKEVIAAAQRFGVRSPGPPWYPGSCSTTCRKPCGSVRRRCRGPVEWGASSC